MATVHALPDASAWTLDPDLAYLNHGGFGATPIPVLERQRELRAALEANPTAFLTRQLPGLLGLVRPAWPSPTTRRPEPRP
jgi:hypothetical protein